MSFDMIVVLCVLTIAIVLFLTEIIRVNVTALGVMTALLLLGQLQVEEAFSGFSNKAVVSIAALFVLGGAIFRTGVAHQVGAKILEFTGKSEKRLLVVIMLTVALLSGFISNTGTVAVLLPAIVSLSKRIQISAAKLLIPLSFASLLGGALTLIGTPPNLIVSELLREKTGTPFSFFAFFPVGIILLGVGVLYMLFWGRRLLPERDTEPLEVQHYDSPAELRDRYELSKNTFRCRVTAHSSLGGKELSEAQLPEQFNVFVTELQRSSTKAKNIAVSAGTIIEPQDMLLLHGNLSDIRSAAAQFQLAIVPAESEKESDFITDELGIAEVLLAPRSKLIGKSLKELLFGSQHHLTVLSINRPGVQEKLDIGNTPLQFGDTLLVQGTWKNIARLKTLRKEVVVLGEPEGMLEVQKHRKAPLVLAIMAAMVLAVISNLLSVPVAAISAALLVILTGCLKIEEAYESIDWRSIMVIAGMIPLSIAMSKVGLISLAAESLVQLLGSYSPYALLGGLFFLTSFLTQVISNTATTVLIAPVAYQAAEQMSVDPRSFLIGVAIAASMAFGSPVASPTNTLVMGPADYRFRDFVIVGVPLIALLMGVTLVVLPIFFPFY